jgi:hypothetical protein
MPSFFNSPFACSRWVWGGGMGSGANFSEGDMNMVFLLTFLHATFTTPLSFSMLSYILLAQETY